METTDHNMPHAGQGEGEADDVFADAAAAGGNWNDVGASKQQKQQLDLVVGHTPGLARAVHGV